MRGMQTAVCAAGLVVALLASVAWSQAPAGSAFTFQGQLRQEGRPVNGPADFEFTLWDAAEAGNQLGYIDNAAVDVTNGLFSVQLDFGEDAFDGRARWLEVSVRYPSGTGSYTPLSPRQQLTPTPYALALPGLRTQQNETSPNLIGGHADNVVDAGVVGATIGGGGVAFEAEPPQPNQITDDFGTIGGGFGNTAGNLNADLADAEAATVGGGKNNQASYRYTTVSGGAFNTATASGATVCGGANNHATITYATVAGGQLNNAQRRGAAIGGGRENVASGEDSTISGGNENAVSISGNGAVVGGGSSNEATNNYSTIGGGEDNEASGSGATLAGGRYNHAAGYNASVGGGAMNIASGSHSTVAGGFSNVAGGDYSFAGGYRAKVRDAAETGDSGGDEGTFVWADSTTPFQDYFTSTGPNQFLIRASGGVGIGTNAPVAQLDVTTGSNIGTWLNLKNTSSDQRYLFQVNGITPLGDPGREGNLELWGTGPSGNINVFTATPVGKVGINTTYPSNALSVDGGANFTGLVGIGTAIPTGNLDVVSASSISTAVNIMNTSSSQRFLFQVNGDDPGAQNREGNFEIWGLGADVYNVLTATPDGNVGINTNDPRNALSVDGLADFNGLVGIGTATPTANLDVASAHPSGTIINISNDSSSQRYLFQVNGNDPGGEGREGNFEIWGTGPSGNHNVITATRDGKVGIRTSTPGSILPAAVLEVSGGDIALGNGGGVYTVNNAGTAVGAGFSTTVSDELHLVANGAVSMVVDGDGKVGIGSLDPTDRLTVGGVIRSTSGGFKCPDGSVLASATGANIWAKNGAGAYYNGGNVGIGTNAPTSRIHSKNTQAGVLTYPLKLANEGTSAGTAAGMLFQVDGGTDRGKGGIAYERRTTFNRGDLHFLQNDSANPDAATLDDAVMTIRNAGWIGMGTTAPAAQLDITSDNTSWTGVNLKNLASNQRYLFQVNGTQPGVTRAGNLEIWGTSATANFNVFTATPGGKFGIGRTDPAHPLQIGTTYLDGNGAHLTAGGIWTNGSDRNSKKDFEPIDTAEILAKVVDIPVTRWQYKGEDEGIQHIGPMAQDFYTAFGLGGSNKHIGTVDADGVALAAIQGVHQLVKENETQISALVAARDAEIATLRTETTTLRVRLEMLEAMMAELTNQGNGAE